MEREPPETETSSTVKSVESSESEKVRVVVSPAVRDVTSELMLMVGRTVSTESVTVLSASFSS